MQRRKKEEKNKKLNPDINLIYDKLFKRYQNTNLTTENSDHNGDAYCTFNPHNKKNEYQNLRKKLKEELNSLVLTKNNDDEKY